MTNTDPFALTSPCVDCPFRTDRHGFLGACRARQVTESIPKGSAFPCHHTINYGDTEDGNDYSRASQCAGAMILLQRVGHPNQPVQIGERFGVFDPPQLDAHAPVFTTVDEFVKHHDIGGSNPTRDGALFAKWFRFIRAVTLGSARRA